MPGSRARRKGYRTEARGRAWSHVLTFRHRRISLPGAVTGCHENLENTTALSELKLRSGAVSRPFCGTDRHAGWGISFEYPGVLKVGLFAELPHEFLFIVKWPRDSRPKTPRMLSGDIVSRAPCNTPD